MKTRKVFGCLVLMAWLSIGALAVATEGPLAPNLGPRLAGGV